MVTVKALGTVSLCESGLVTCTSHGPPAATDRSKVPMIWLALTTVAEMRSMLVIPLSILAVAPGWKFSPAKMVMETVLLVSPLSGLML